VAKDEGQNNPFVFAAGCDAIIGEERPGSALELHIFCGGEGEYIENLGAQDVALGEVTGFESRRISISLRGDFLGK
jgi:hypothetical protein